MEENIAIVVLNYCNYSLSEECVDSLMALGIKSKIVIVDNNSNNNSYEHMNSYFKDYNRVFVIKNESNSGYAAGNNTGIRYILKKDPSIKYLCIMNPDIILTYKEILTNLADKLEKYSDLAVITGLMVGRENINFKSLYWSIPTNMELLFEHLNWTNPLFNKRNNERNSLSPKKDGTANVEVVPGCFFMIKRTVLEEINMLDEGTFLYNEENILAIDLKKRGYKEAISINDFYIHNHNPSVSQKTLKQWYKLSSTGYKSRQYLCSKYDNYKVLSVLLKIVQALNYFDITIRYVGSCCKRKLKGVSRK